MTRKKQRLRNQTPKTFAAKIGQALSLHQQGKFAQAKKVYEDVLASEPNQFDALHLLGVVELQTEHTAQGARLIEKAIAINPRVASAHSNLGHALKDLGRLDEALASYGKALALEPDLADVYNGRGSVFKDLKRYDESCADYDKAVALKPGFADAHHNKSFVKLSLDDYDEGWALYEWRWKTRKSLSTVRNFSQKLWLGNDAIAGKTILVHAEQGLGDSIHFYRYLSELEKTGNKIIFEAPGPLVSLFAAQHRKFQLIAKGASLPDFEFHCPLMSLPLAFKTKVETIPASIPYLGPAPEKAALWRAKLGEKAKARIAWCGPAIPGSATTSGGACRSNCFYRSSMTKPNGIRCRRTFANKISNL
jgi:tetratricopeptide (TPR) repeat protein